ncbi:hypothetical protein [Bradyrhizobium sp. B117]|uniref:hypothetical protein n=1 Tax=Bradyrhizobium sp. B117 TaxID=3140246 RepID=UPI003182D409
MRDFLVDLAVVIMKARARGKGALRARPCANPGADRGMYDRNLVASALVNLTPLVGKN